MATVLDTERMCGVVVCVEFNEIGEGGEGLKMIVRVWTEGELGANKRCMGPAVGCKLDGHDYKEQLLADDRSLHRSFYIVVSQRHNQNEALQIQNTRAGRCCISKFKFRRLIQEARVLDDHIVFPVLASCFCRNRRKAQSWILGCPVLQH